MAEKHPGGRPRLYTAPTTVRLKPETRAAVDRLAARNRWTPADTIRYLVEEALAARETAAKEQQS